MVCLVFVARDVSGHLDLLVRRIRWVGHAFTSPEARSEHGRAAVDEPATTAVLAAPAGCCWCPWSCSPASRASAAARCRGSSGSPAELPPDAAPVGPARPGQALWRVTALLFRRAGRFNGIERGTVPAPKKSGKRWRLSRSSNQTTAHTIRYLRCIFVERMPQRWSRQTESSLQGLRFWELCCVARTSLPLHTTAAAHVTYTRGRLRRPSKTEGRSAAK